jgi:hypothetical protein
MPTAPKFHIEQMHELTLQVQRAPQKVQTKQIQATLELLEEIDGQTLYPLDYIIFRITGYRGDASEQPMLVGGALIGDLVSLIARVSRKLHIASQEMLTVVQVAMELQVSLRTVSRLRRDGLVFYWVVEPSGRRRLGCTQEMLHSFQERKRERLESASHFSRLTPQEQQHIVQSALQYKGSGRSLNDIACELSSAVGRGHETIRTLLQSDESIKSMLKQQSPLTKRDAREIERARRVGISWEVLTNRFHRSRDALRKAIARHRATRLRQFEITYVDLDVFLRDDAEEVILGSQIVTNLPSFVLSIDPLTFGAYAMELKAPDEIGIASAMHLLRKRARDAIQTLAYTPKVRVLEKIENDLCWSFLLQQQLMLKAIPSSVAVAVQHAGRPLHELPSGRVLDLMQRVISVVGDVCGMLNPSIGQTASKTPASVLDRTLSSLDVSHPKEIAASRQKTPRMLMPFARVVPWSYLLTKTK